MKVLLYSALFIFLLACSSEKKNDDQNSSDLNNDSEQIVTEDDYLVYTVPTPTMISSAFKMLGLEFNETVLVETSDPNITYNHSVDRALNLGVNLIDLGYSALFDQTQSTIKYMAKVKMLTEQLNIQSQDMLNASKRIEDNFSNPDSLNNLIVELQSSIDEYYLNQEEHEVSLLVLTGMYIEGLYFTSIYYDVMKDNDNWNDYKKYFDQLLLQQNSHLKNLNELMGVYNTGEEYVELRESLKKLEQVFIDLDFNYTLDKKGTHIDKVYFERKDLHLLKEVISEIRGDIISA